MNRKFMASFEELEEEEERKMRHKASAAQNTKKKNEKRQQKQEKQKHKEDAKEDAKEDRVQTHITTKSRISNLLILGLSGDQDNYVAIRSAFRRLALQYHPDKNPDPDATETFKKIHTAYETLNP